MYIRSSFRIRKTFYSKFEYFTVQATIAARKKRRLATLLKQVRMNAGLTQVQVAELLGETQSCVSKYESGEQRLGLIEIEAFCEVVGISLVEFIRLYLES